MTRKCIDGCRFCRSLKSKCGAMILKAAIPPGLSVSERRDQMVTIVDLNSELGKLKMLRGRTPQSSAAERAGTAAQLVPYRDGHIFTSKFAGKGAWERHPAGEELVHILDGEAVLQVVTEDGTQTLEVGAG